MMQSLKILLSIGIFFISCAFAHADPIERPAISLQGENIPDFQGQEKLKQLVPAMRIEDENQAIQQNQDPNGFSILGRSDNIFPKSKLPGSINPIFDGSNFDTNKSGKRSKLLEFAPDDVHSKGVNDSFRNKEAYEVEIPPELKEFYRINSEKDKLR